MAESPEARAEEPEAPGAESRVPGAEPEAPGTAGGTGGGAEQAARRGRRPSRPDPASGPVALLAHRLWELKERAGDPSFAEMSSRLGAAASKSSLAAAARGQVLPSWETTWEFVRVLAVGRLGQDPQEARREWRAHWERARSGAQGPAVGHGPPEAGDRAGYGPSSAEAPAVRGPSGHPGRRGSGGGSRPPHVRRPLVLGVLGALAAGGAGGAGALVILLSSSGDRGADGAPVSDASQTRAVAPGDDSVFEGDVTHPDGTTVRRGTHFTKVWRIRNAGSVSWHGRYLTRISDDDPCRAPERVPIERTGPGESVDISVRMRAADAPGRCRIYWKMTNGSGAPVFAGKNPIFLDVNVE
ncbi:hypothetical protein GCM10010466_38460 [Planomonospora alba]|uniref:Nbr1 FW domain-containing protein n=1 Tax=Planomonospora alba TaxID=161354 RepID=A0ABP6NCN0_9ACTN